MQLAQYVAILIEDGRKYVQAKPGMKDEEVLTETEIQELAGHMLANDLDTPKFEDFLKYTKQFAVNVFAVIANNCIDSNLYNDHDVADVLRSVVRYYYEDTNEMQVLLTNYRAGQWLQHQQTLQHIKQEELQGAVNE